MKPYRQWTYTFDIENWSRTARQPNLTTTCTDEAASEITIDECIHEQLDGAILLVVTVTTASWRLRVDMAGFQEHT
jgi:hypothetical protein